MAMTKILDGGSFFEGPRWHDGRWWVSDFFRHVVLSFDAAGGDVREEARVPGQPSGLGWTPDGDLLVVSMVDRRLLRRRADAEPGAELEEVADLSSVAGGPCNDMVVGPNGDAWIGNMGFEYWRRDEFATATLAHVDPRTGVVTAAADDLRFPNGSVVTPDGSTLIVGESFGARYTAFDIDGATLTNRRVWAELPGVAPDGCALDAEGRIWCADALGHRCVLVEEGGRIVDELAAPDGLAVYACMLGGDDGRTLALCCAPDSDAERRQAAREAAVYVTDVAVPHAGLP